MIFKINISFILTFVVYYSLPIMADSNLKVLVTIKPFHSIVSAVMEGVSEPKLLLKANESPHNYTLKPTSAQSIQDSDVIFWGGISLENYLAKYIDIFENRMKVVSFIEMDEILLLKVPNFKKKIRIKKFSKNKNLKNDRNKYFGVDPHIWLDPMNAKVIVNNSIKILSQIDPKNSKKYFYNGEKYKIILDELDKELSNNLKSISSIPFMVFHNAYQYFENRYNLNIVGEFKSNKSFGMSVRRMREIQKIISGEKIQCVFIEINMPKKLLNTAIEGTNTRIAVLDPLGANLNEGPGLYSKLLKNLSNELIKCLGDTL